MLAGPGHEVLIGAAAAALQGQQAIQPPGQALRGGHGGLLEVQQRNVGLAERSKQVLGFVVQGAALGFSGLQSGAARVEIFVQLIVQALQLRPILFQRTAPRVLAVVRFSQRRMLALQPGQAGEGAVPFAGALPHQIERGIALSAGLQHSGQGL